MVPHRRSMIVEAESPAFDDDREQLSRARQSMTLPRNMHYQQQYRPPQPPPQQQDQLNSMKRSSFNHSVPPVSMQTVVSPPSQIPASPSAGPTPKKSGILNRNSSIGIDSFTSPPPPPTTVSAVLNGSCVDSGLGGSDSSSFTFAEMHQGLNSIGQKLA